ncbi:hypothetical protein COU49_02250 [Candidatus Nomurabacteria bacterium CG10_big_fil_rev_8_21_14_0_10_35_16]|uniref:Uncharacterized protein n=1 Tax=Candidatus Nomurabacteria bacterium CG10_big_fil_rev_8_21_14_0_10_35_16 TaxID=1974731 RepID=A0A2H0TAY5_9BACT|nr:MAG: hypothetical protein COU49_02250 [Candidatus Nomurabacteria bacterium CG10_big_fil_rev_8_21_14_0_10_35_16]
MLGMKSPPVLIFKIKVKILGNITITREQSIIDVLRLSTPDALLVAKKAIVPNAIVATTAFSFGYIDIKAIGPINRLRNNQIIGNKPMDIKKYIIRSFSIVLRKA